MDDATDQWAAVDNALKELKKNGFTASRIPAVGEIQALNLTRSWSSGVLDTVTIFGPDDAKATRTHGVDPSSPLSGSSGAEKWRAEGPVVDVVSEMLSQPAADSQLVVVSIGGSLWTP